MEDTWGAGYALIYPKTLLLGKQAIENKNDFHDLITFVSEEVLAVLFLVDLNHLHSKTKLLQPPKRFNDARDNWPIYKG